MLAFAPAVVFGMATMPLAAAAPGDGSGVDITASPIKVHPGDKVTFTVTVTNNFDEKFRDVSINSSVSSCDRPSLGALDINESVSYKCTTTAPENVGDHTVTVTATAKLDHGRDTGYGHNNDKVTGMAKVKYTVGPEQNESPSPSPSHSKSPSPSPSHPKSSSPNPSASPSTSPSGETYPSPSLSSTWSGSLSPARQLPTTGSSTPIVLLTAGAFGLLAAGGVLLILARRRRING
jgi:LPXTG-motif cell wall-anchored protein